jgi:hypothetical protein
MDEVELTAGDVVVTADDIELTVGNVVVAKG